MKRSRSIRTRLIWSLLLLICLTFVFIFVVFNMAVQQYIDTSARRELTEAVSALTYVPVTHEQDDDGISPQKMPRTRKESDDWEDSVDRRPPNAIGAQVRSFVWDGNDPPDSDDTVTEKDQKYADRLTALAIARHMNLRNALEDVQTVRADNRTYLVRALELDTETPSYFVMYVDITQIQNLVRNINVLLLFILVIVGSLAVLVALRLASSIAEPIEKISEFARQIGNNEFTQSELVFADTEPAELLAVMNATASKLEKYDSDQKTFFQNVSHELKTPLMTIRCNAEGIMFHIMDPTNSGKTIITETDRLVDMIDDLIFISKMDQISDTEVQEENDLREILSNCAEAQRSSAQQKDVHITYDFDDDPVLLRVSEKNISRAFSNLISNAIRYAKSEVALACRTEGDNDVVRVWNDGPPISDTDLPHIFERFFKGPEGQSGIGLSIVRSITEKLNGTVEVISDESGTCFTMLLPRNISSDEE